MSCGDYEQCPRSKIKRKKYKGGAKQTQAYFNKGCKVILLMKYLSNHYWNIFFFNCGFILMVVATVVLWIYFVFLGVSSFPNLKCWLSFEYNIEHFASATPLPEHSNFITFLWSLAILNLQVCCWWKQMYKC